MNILREVRRVRNKSMPIRLILLLAFCVIFIVTTYAWFSTQRDVTFGGLHGEMTQWDVAYYIKANKDSNESQMLHETAVFTIDEFYPGMPSRQDLVHVYNLGTASTEVMYELISVKVFGEEILKKKANGDMVLEVNKTNADGQDYVEEVAVTKETTAGITKTNVFSADTEFPFEINYTYDRTKLIGTYVEGQEGSDKAHSTLSFYMNWDYEGTLEKDMLDTKFGKDAYSYYESGKDKTKALEIMVRITSKMVHPGADPDYVEQ